MADASDPFFAPNWKLGDAKCFIFFTFYNWIWFGNCETLFVNISFLISMLFLLTYIDVRTAKFFLPAES